MPTFIELVQQRLWEAKVRSWWIEPNGKWHNIGDTMTHDDWSMRHRLLSREEALDKGWIRCYLMGAGAYIEANRKLSKQAIVNICFEMDEALKFTHVRVDHGWGRKGTRRWKKNELVGT